MKRIFWLVNLALALCLFGCGGSDDLVDNLLEDQNDGAQFVAHESWNSYRLYQYKQGSWQLLVNLGTDLVDTPQLGERPVLLVHGLGSDIQSGSLDNLARSLQDSSSASSIFAFEYDTLDPVSTNSIYFLDAIAYLTQTEKNRSFRVVGHSMGGLVIRSAFESGNNFDMVATGNRVVFAATPHLGSEIAEVLVNGDLNIVQDALRRLVLGGQLVFRNADGSLAEVRGDEASFLDLAPSSPFLTSINDQAATSHPQFDYRTVAGNQRGEDFQTFNQLLGTFADDGLVDVSSANASIIGPLQTETVAEDHSSIIRTDNGVSQIEALLDI